MHSPRKRNALGALFGALLLVACGGGGPSHTSDSDSAPTSDAASSGAATTTTVTTTAATMDPSTSPDTCEPTTCVAAGKTCGAIPDGCGEMLECGECLDPESCGGGGVDNVCGRPCVAVRAIFFDLGDTLVESDGDLFVERPGASATIAGLKALGMRVGIITNTPAEFTVQDLKDLLEDPSFLDEFEVLLLSSLAASPPKPDPAIFLEAHGLLPDAPPVAQVAFVTENLAEVADLELAPTQGARAAGMVGIHLSSDPPSPLADYTIAPDQLNMLVALAESEWLTCAGAP
jgi:FMN phosphatase YigB (HAD superfamily)